MEAMLKTVEIDWKKRSAYYRIVILWIAMITTYAVTISTENPFVLWKALLASAIPILLIFYVIINRLRLPKAKRNTLGILFAIDYPVENLSQVVSCKFITPFEEMISKSKET
jgi:hypothetical protein